MGRKKRHGEWKSTTVAEGYVDRPIAHKNAIAERILPTFNNSADFKASFTSTLVPVLASTG